MNNYERGRDFFNQKIEWDSSIFFPDGYEELFLLIYFIFLPYVSGILFIFIIVSRFKLKLFDMIMSNHNFLLTWAIGYEILAITTLLIIFKNAINFIFGTQKKENKYSYINNHKY